MSEYVPLSAFVERTYLASLRGLQNEDGGWSFNAGCESRVEPTSWALLALQEFDSSAAADESVDRGLRFLIESQLENGSWAASGGQREGCWVTSLACWALRSRKEYAANLLKGLHWLNDDRPRDSTFWWRLVRKLADRERVNAQSSSLSGWSWTPNTASWVEPTCYALIVQQIQTAALESDSRRRCELAVAMLYNRMCPGGGWNCGNPRIYGVAGQPQVGPTVWALIALREHSQRPENRMSLEWLENNQELVRSPESFALTRIALSVYGRNNQDMANRANSFQSSAALSLSVPALSWAALAFSETARWLNAAPNPNS